MKKKKLKELHQESVANLRKMLDEWVKDLVEMRLLAKIGKVKDVSGVKRKRRDIARLKTIITEKQMFTSKEG